MPESDDGLAWYEDLREKYLPDRIRCLLIAESPPDPGAGQRRFFYAPNLSYDNLYRGVAEAVYGAEPSFDVRAKREILQRLQKDGFWLIDAVQHPINKESHGPRVAAIRRAVPELVERCRRLRPAGVIICHAVVFSAIAQPLREADIPLLHSVPIPFPLANVRERFIVEFRAGLRRLPAEGV